MGSLIHTGDVSFCQDGAPAIAAAVAAGFVQDATIDDVLDAAIHYLKPTSASVVRDLINEALDLAKETDDYGAFRAAFQERYSRPILCDSRETIPATLALCYLAQGDLKEVICFGANFGRDSDTIATMAGAICGALNGASGLPTDWVEQIRANSFGDQESLAKKLVEVAKQKAETEIKR